jgi:two-component system sensor histidine kinase/response regulator
MNTHKRRILFVEDDEIDRMAFERFAQQEHFPYDYLIADSVQQTKRSLKSERFDAAVIDYALGDGTAFDVFNDLKGTPMIIVTGIGAVEIAVNAMKAGAYDYLIKDTERHYLKTLAMTVQNAIRRKQAEDELQQYREHLEELVKERTTELAKANKQLHQQITERKRAEQELRLLAEMVKQSTDSIIRTDTEFRITYINEAAKELFGWNLAELQGKTPDMLKAGPYGHSIQTDIYTTISSGKPYFGEALNVRKDGSRFYCQFKFSPLVDEYGKIYGYMGSQRDITKRKHTEEALRESEASLQSIFRAAPIGIGLVSNRILLQVNDQMCEMLGYSRDELIGKSARLLYPTAEDFEYVGKEKYGQIRERGTGTVETRWKRKDGTIIDILLSSTPIEPTDLSFGITFTALDITERKRTEHELQKHREHLEELVEERTSELQREIEERKQMEAALAEERNLLQTLIDNLPDYIYVKDRESRFLLANKASMRGLGITTLDELVGKTDFDFFPEEFSEQYYCDEQAIFESRQPLINREERNIDLTTGVINWVLTTKVPLRDNQGHIVGIVGIGRNITKHKQMDEELRKAKERAEEAQRAAEKALQSAEAANRAKSQFLANMSHELRTPLNAILGFARLMERDPVFPMKHKANLGIISHSGEHLLNLINDVLELSKIEAGQHTLVKTNFDFYLTLNNLEEMMHLRAEKKGLHLIFERAIDVSQYIKTDEHKLRQILINLLGNAIKFTEEGSVTLRVRCCDGEMGRWGDGEMGRQGDKETGRQGETEIGRGEVFPPILPSPHHPISLSPHLLFEVEDTGPGIAPEELDTLFDAFTQTESGQKTQEGTGLGLALTRQFVQLMGGNISVSSRVGQGTIFTVEIPIELVKVSEIQPRKTARRVIGLEPEQHAADGGSYRILVVDDNPESRLLLRTLLEAVGFTIQEADNGQQAVDLYESWQPHLIWMDLRMPVMDGYEATKRIRSEIRNSKSEIQTFIVAITSSAFEENRSDALAVGCDDFVRKPFREADIFDVIHKHLGIRFVYEEPEQCRKAAGLQEQAHRDVLTPETFAALPSDLLMNLEQAIVQLDGEMIQQAIEEIRPHNALLTDALAMLAKDFQYDKILTFIQK